MANSLALIPWEDQDREERALPLALRPELGVTTLDTVGPGRLLHVAYSSAGRRLEKTLGQAAHTLGLGPAPTSCRIENAFGDDASTRQSTLDTMYDSFRSDTAEGRLRVLKKECGKLFEYTHLSKSQATRMQTFGRIIMLTTRYPGLRRIFFQSSAINKVAHSPDAICEFWRNTEYHTGTEARFLLDFAAYCLVKYDISIYLEGIRPSELGRAPEEGLGVVDKLLVRYFDGESGFPRLIAIRYVAGILGLRTFWLENYRIQRHTMDKLCQKTLRLVEDINPDSMCIDDCNKLTLLDPDGIDTLIEEILVGGKRWIEQEPRIKGLGSDYWVTNFIKLIKMLRGLILPDLLPMAFRRAAENWEGLLKGVTDELLASSLHCRYQDTFVFVNESVESQSAKPPNTSKPLHPIGSEVLVHGVAPITADIVFVHGLGGHRRETWTKDNVCWPQELLSREEALSHTRILTFGYDANIVDRNGRASLNTLFQHSINLIQELSQLRRKDARDRPIIFVAHSLGGLIVKDALNYSNQVQNTHPHLAQIFTVTRGVIFLGTPHRGSDANSIVKVVASVAQMALQNPRLDLIRDLERDSQTLDRIGDSFSRILDKRTLAIWSFAEELALTGIGKVVPGESAIIGDAYENRETIHGNHISMVKFSTKDDLGYKKVLNSIEMILEGFGEDSLNPSKQGKTFYSIPPFRVPHFVEREILYARLQMLFDSATTTSTPLVVVLVGVGGVGKTQLALEYCHRMKDSRRFGAIFWLDASSRNTLYSSMETAAKQLLPERVFDNTDAAVASFNDVLSRWSERWLLVFDNLDNPEDLPGIPDFFPASHRGSILITSRNAGSKVLGQSVELGGMMREEGLQLLLRSSVVDSSSVVDTDELEAADEILNLLGDYPLAIDQARAYISKRHLRLRTFVTEYESRKQSLMQEIHHPAGLPGGATL